MKKINLILAFIMILGIFAFKTNQPLEQLKLGTYGVCMNDDNTSSKLNFTLNEDHTFSYSDYFDTKNKVDVKGTWTAENNTIIIKEDNNTNTIPKQWHLDNNVNCLKSKKGMEFIRLCHLNACH